MQLSSLLIGIVIGAVLTLVATRLLRREAELPEARFEPEPVAPSYAERPLTIEPPRAPVTPLTLSRPPGDELFNELVERNQRLNRDTSERLLRGTPGPPEAPPEPVSREPELGSAARLARLTELNRRLDADTRRRLGR